MRAVAARTGLGLLLTIVIVLVARQVGSQPVRNRILDDLDVQQVGEVTTILVSLTSPVRYVRHFPYESGENLRIKIRPFNLSSDNREAIFNRESLVPPDNEHLPLNEVVYEDDFESGGPYLTLYFTRPVNFEVQQGTDSRSIMVYVSEPAMETATEETATEETAAEETAAEETAAEETAAEETAAEETATEPSPLPTPE